MLSLTRSKLLLLQLPPVAPQAPEAPLHFLLQKLLLILLPLL